MLSQIYSFECNWIFIEDILKVIEISQTKSVRPTKKKQQRTIFTTATRDSFMFDSHSYMIGAQFLLAAECELKPIL